MLPWTGIIDLIVAQFHSSKREPASRHCKVCVGQNGNTGACSCRFWIFSPFILCHSLFQQRRRKRKLWRARGAQPDSVMQCLNEQTRAAWHPAYRNPISGAMLIVSYCWWTLTDGGVLGSRTRAAPVELLALLGHQAPPPVRQKK